MSSPGPSHDFKFLDESEWRVLYLVDEKGSQHPDQASIIPPDRNPDSVPKIKFGPDDLKILVFPDQKTRQMALEDDEILEWFNRKIPIIATVDECLHF